MSGEKSQMKDLQKEIKMAEVAAVLAKVTADTTSGIMHELSAIRTDLAVNTVNTKNIGDKLDELKNGTKAQVEDHEQRIRMVETNVTKVMTWGSALILIIGVLEFMISKFWVK